MLTSSVFLQAEGRRRQDEQENGRGADEEEEGSAVIELPRGTRQLVFGNVHAASRKIGGSVTICDGTSDRERPKGRGALAAIPEFSLWRSERRTQSHYRVRE